MCKEIDVKCKPSETLYAFDLDDLSALGDSFTWRKGDLRKGWTKRYAILVGISLFPTWV